MLCSTFWQWFCCSLCLSIYTYTYIPVLPGVLKSLHLCVSGNVSLSSRIKNGKSMSRGVWLSEYKCSCDRAVFSHLWSAIYQVCVLPVHSQPENVVCAGWGGGPETDRQVCTQCVSLIRCDGSLFGRSPAVDAYRWLSSLTLFLNEGLCSLVSDAHVQTSALVHTHRQLHLDTRTTE